MEEEKKDKLHLEHIVPGAILKYIEDPGALGEDIDATMDLIVKLGVDAADAAGKAAEEAGKSAEDMVAAAVQLAETTAQRIETVLKSMFSSNQVNPGGGD